MSARPLAGVLLAALIAVMTRVGVSADAAVDTRIRLVTQAIAEAVRARMSPAKAVVTVDSITDLRFDADVRFVTAHVSPYARAGEPTRFVLTAPGGARGEATAEVRVRVEGVSARVDIHRGSRITARDVEPLQIDLIRRPIRAVATLADVLGAKALRDLDAGATLNKNDVTAEPAVRAGREVTAHVVIGDARVTGTLVAAQNGLRNQVIRVLNPETREVRRARVIDVDEVEVLRAQ